MPLVMMAVIGTLAYNFSVVLPLFAHDIFHRGPGNHSTLTVAMGIGALAGGLALAARQRPSHKLLVAVSLAFGVFILAVAAAPTLLLCMAMLVLMGAASIAFIATANSLLQLNSSAAMRGRVMALWAVVFPGVHAHPGHHRLPGRAVRRPFRTGSGRRRDHLGGCLGGPHPATDPVRPEAEDHHQASPVAVSGRPRAAPP